MKKSILITGADGYIGSKLAEKLLLETDNPLILWLRATDKQEFEMKQSIMNKRLPTGSGRVGYSTGDLRSETPFELIDRSDVASIIHCAAATRFNIDEKTARKVNIEGSQKLFSFADGCSNLERLSLVSTVYASGLRSGIIEESPMPVTSFANLYEQSKWQSEHLLLTGFDHLPWQIFRTATVIADDRHGKVSQLNAFHNTLKLFYYGLLSLIPGSRDTTLYFVESEFVAEAILESLKLPRSQSIFHVCHRKDESATLGNLIDIAFDIFNEDSGFKKRRVLPPLFADQESFELFNRTITRIDSGLVSNSVASISPFSQQLFINKDIYNDNTMKNIPDYDVPDAEQFVRNTCRNLVETKWGLVQDHAA